MARRARQNRNGIPGYDETRPPREERKRQHRQVRHAANQILSTMEDPEDLALPKVRRVRQGEGNNGSAEADRRRFRVWKTKFWKRRDSYRDMKAEIDSNWPVITSHQLEP
ncbi:MAG: hypothetical protein ACLFWM_02865 [Actinomycetota bacterium]